MAGFFLLCLLSALLTSGSSLVCEVCRSKEASCSGSLQTCDDSEDTCSTMVAEFKIAGRYFMKTYKECTATSPICDFIPFSMTFRPSISLRTSFNCCKSDGCNTAQIQLPAAPRTPNGFQCPSCFAYGVSRCRNMDILQCSGSEDHCFEITGTLMVDNVNFTKTAAGCGSAGICSKKVGTYHYSKTVVDILTKVKCYPASQVGSPGTEL